MSETHSDVARALFAAIAAGDVAAVDALYHDDAVVFMNTTGATLEKRKMLGVIRFLSTQVSQLRYEDVRLQPTPTGFVQQHVLACRAPGGEEVRAHACLVAVVEDGRIRRLDEYLDAAAIAPLTTPALTSRETALNGTDPREEPEPLAHAPVTGVVWEVRIGG